MNKQRKFKQEQIITSPNGVAPCVITRAEGKLNIALEEFGQLRGGRFDRMYKINRRVYDVEGLAPTCNTCGGGNTETKIAEPNNLVAEPTKKYYRIRKLTPLECFRLMGVRDEDYQKVAANQSDSSLYHLAGDSIVVDVLMAIFGEML